MTDGHATMETLSNLISFVKESLELISNEEDERFYSNETEQTDMGIALDNFHDAISNLEDIEDKIMDLSEFYEKYPQEVTFDKEYLYTNYRDHVTIRVMTDESGGPVVRRFADMDAWQEDYDASKSRYKCISNRVGIIVSDYFIESMKEGGQQ